MTDYTAEARRHLKAHMERQRQARVSSHILEEGFRDGEIQAPVDAGMISGAEADSEIESAKASARAFVLIELACPNTGDCRAQELFYQDIEEGIAETRAGYDLEPGQVEVTSDQ